jgi:hypothetical protein
MIIDKSKFAMEHGVKASTISGWMQRHWTKGQHYYVIGRTTLINTEEVEQWIKYFQQGLNHAEMDLKSESLNKEKLFTKRLSRQTPTMRLTLGA